MAGLTRWMMRLPAKTSIILFLAPCVSAQQCESMKVLFILGIFFGVCSLIYTYQRTQVKGGLEHEIRREKKLLKRLREEIAENRDALIRQRMELGEGDDAGEIAARMRESMDTSRRKASGISKHFWNKIEIEGSQEEVSEVDALLDEKREIEEMIKLTKNKYHRRVIDEASFNEITKDYQKKLIEVESRIRKIEERD